MYKTICYLPTVIIGGAINKSMKQVFTLFLKQDIFTIIKLLAWLCMYVDFFLSRIDSKITGSIGLNELAIYYYTF